MPRCEAPVEQRGEYATIVGMDTVIARSDLAKQTGTKIREFRTDRGLSQQQLADAIGIHRVSLAKIESGRVLADWITIVNVAQYLGVSTENLKNS